MKPITSRHAAEILTITSLSFLLVFAIDGCKKDETLQPGPTYPSIQGHWVGTVSAIFSGTPGVFVSTLEGDIAQTDASVGGSWVYTFTGQVPSAGNQTSSKFKGTISLSGQISIAETSWVPLNWSGQNWGLNSYSGTLSSKGDTIYAKGTTDTVNIKQTLVLVKH